MSLSRNDPGLFDLEIKDDPNRETRWLMRDAEGNEWTTGKPYRLSLVKKLYANHTIIRRIEK